MPITVQENIKSKENGIPDIHENTEILVNVKKMARNSA